MTSVTNLEPILRAHPLLAGLPEDYTRLLVGCASNVRYEAGALLARQDEPADRFFLIRHGDVSIEAAPPGRGSVAISTVHAGEMLGWAWLVPPYRWAFDVRAVTLTRAIAFDAACLRDKCETNHDLGYELLKRVAWVMSDRLSAARIQLLDLYGTP